MSKTCLWMNKKPEEDVTSDLQFSVQTQPAKKFEIWNTYLQLNLHGDVLSKKNETAVILTKVKIFSSDATVVAAGSGQLERRRGVSQRPQVTSEGPSTHPAGTTANHHGQKEKKNSFLLMLKQHRETKLLNNTSYNIVCTLLCIEHFLLPIKKTTTQSLEKWRYKKTFLFEARRASIDNFARGTQHKVTLTRYWERESTDNNFAVESPHNNNNNTKSPPKYSTNGTTYTTLKMTIFLPIFVCLVKMFFINYDSESQSKLSKC